MRARAMAACCCAVLAVSAVLPAMSPRHAERASPPDFLPEPKDRPVLETVQQVWRARTTGVCDFEFDGVHYVVSGLPKEYIDYSAWCVRMP